MAEKPESSADNSAAEVMKEVIEPKVKGLVKWFNVKNGYGFVQRHDTKEDLFIHQSSIIANNPSKARKSVGENENIEFAVAKGPKGLEAINVTGPDGTPVQGSRYARDIGQRRGPRNRNFSQSSQRGRPSRGGSAGGRARQRGGRMDRGPMRGPYMNYPPNFYPGAQGYMPEPGFPGNNRMMYYRQGPPPPRNFFRPPGPGGYYFRSGPEGPMEGGYGQGRPSRGRGGRRNNRSQDRTESANMSGAGDQQQQQPSGRGRQRNSRRKRKSTNKSESEVEKNVENLSNGMKKMTVNGPDDEGVRATA